MAETLNRIALTTGANKDIGLEIGWQLAESDVSVLVGASDAVVLVGSGWRLSRDVFRRNVKAVRKQLGKISRWMSDSEGMLCADRIDSRGNGTEDSPA